MEPIGYDRNRATQILEKYDIDLVVASTGVNTFYATGFPSLHVANNPILWVLKNQFPFLALVQRNGDVDLIYWMLFSSLNEFSWISPDRAHGILSSTQALRQLGDLIKERELGCKTIGLESLMPRYMSEFLRTEFPGANLVEADPVFLEMRIMKSEEEIQRIKKSTEISELAIQACIDTLREGVTDNELLRIARRTIVETGAEGWDHLTLGIGSSDPEAPGTGTRAGLGDLVRLDFGTVWRGYVSDLSRHAVLGAAPEGAEEVMERMIMVQEFCAEQIRPGAGPGTVFKEAQEFHRTLSKRGRVYPTCHSIGLEVEEIHMFSAMHVADFPFEENMVLDIEVWQHFKDSGLLGIEDCYRVTSSGCERLSSLDKCIFVK